ncbi:calcium/sodium antiporter [Alteromonas pelagimontana]|uniref:Calcium/sodium antiporter n=1 Tax=Alteromonas pelagimontana TaxID=1858656 RepID=A0A6M4MBV2_9ALTE|nr:calcium/sodium antiporter [Alteromonas pelagimontana]QJR80623.1 calcium/sodium antiporter [Alteromonas pelagimontana]
MLLASLAIIVGFALLVWSADRFVDGAAATASHAGLPPLLIGMVIVGFGTSAPEMVVSAIAALDGNPDLALGNAIGSNIVNSSLILGVTAVIAPIAVHSKIVKKELPLLLLIVLLLGGLLLDGNLSSMDAVILLAGFFGVIGWSVFSALSSRGDALETEFSQEMSEQQMPLARAIMWLIVGLAVLIASSRLLVWGAVEIASALGVSDLIIGLTIVALGTSLPELAASIIAARKGEHDIAIGNVVGSNMFNILAVVGIAGAIEPINQLSAGVLSRDWAVMFALTIGMLLMAYGFGKQGRINRWEGGLLVSAYIAYNGFLAYQLLL